MPPGERSEQLREARRRSAAALRLRSRGGGDEHAQLHEPMAERSRAADDDDEHAQLSEEARPRPRSVWSDDAVGRAAAGGRGLAGRMLGEPPRLAFWGGGMRGEGRSPSPSIIWIGRGRVWEGEPRFPLPRRGGRPTPRRPSDECGAGAHAGARERSEHVPAAASVGAARRAGVKRSATE